MPGVTITHSGPSATLSVRISRGDATQPSSPASRARSARWSTCASTLAVTPTSRWSARRSRLVSTVTPRTSGRGTAKSCAAFVAASAAARIIATPPLAWTSSMRTPRRVASRTAPATVFGMSWNLRSRNTRKPRLRAVSTAVGPAAVKSSEPILQPVTMPSRRPSSRSGAATVKLLEALDLLLALEQGLDGADRGLGAVHRQVVGDVLHDGGAADEVRVLPGAPVLGRVEEERDLAALHQVDDVQPVALGDLVDQFHRHAVALEDARRAGGRDEREAHLGEALGERHHHALVAVLHRDEHLARGGQRRARGDL